MVDLKNLCIRLGKFELKNINLTIQTGEIFAILGKTGSGKTTLLETIAGFHIPHTGNIFFDNQDVSLVPPEKRNVGIVYQDYALFPHLTVYKNIEFGLKEQGIHKTQRHQKILELTALLGIDHLLERYPATLSGGEQQRTALARALVIHPKILLMDEPFCSLDAHTKEKMYAVLQNMYRIFHCTIIFVTHDIAEAKMLAHRVGIIQNGTLTSICKATALTEEAIFAEA